MVRLADRSFPRVTLDALALPFADSAFGAVVMAFVIFYLPEPGLALAEVRRVLQPGGAIGIATWAAEEQSPAQDAWDEELDAAGAPAGDIDVPDGSELTDTPEKVEALLLAAGFRSVASECLPFEKAWSREAFVEMQMKIGWTSRRRLELMPTADRDSFLVAVDRRLASLTDEDLVDRGTVIACTAVAPAVDR